MFAGLTGVTKKSHGVRSRQNHLRHVLAMINSKNVKLFGWLGLFLSGLTTWGLLNEGSFYWLPLLAANLLGLHHKLYGHDNAKQALEKIGAVSPLSDLLIVAAGIATGMGIAVQLILFSNWIQHVFLGETGRILGFSVLVASVLIIAPLLSLAIYNEKSFS